MTGCGGKILRCAQNDRVEGTQNDRSAGKKILRLRLRMTRERRSG